MSDQQKDPNEHAIANARAWMESIREQVAKMSAADDAEDYDAAEEVRSEIMESPLSVQVRTGWFSPGQQADACAEEFEVLLTTGGPALRLVGDLDRDTASNARLEWQEWGTPWTEYRTTEEDDEAISTWLACMYFGEG